MRLCRASHLVHCWLSEAARQPTRAWTPHPTLIRRLPKTTGQWMPTAGPEGAFVGSIVASGANLFAGTSAGVFRFTNNGATWVSSGLESFSVQALAVHGSSVFAGTSGSGIFVSTDGGASWTATRRLDPPGSAIPPRQRRRSLRGDGRWRRVPLHRRWRQLDSGQ